MKHDFSGECSLHYVDFSFQKTQTVQILFSPATIPWFGAIQSWIYSLDVESYDFFEGFQVIDSRWLICLDFDPEFDFDSHFANDFKVKRDSDSTEYQIWPMMLASLRWKGLQEVNSGDEVLGYVIWVDWHEYLVKRNFCLGLGVVELGFEAKRVWKGVQKNSLCFFFRIRRMKTDFFVLVWQGTLSF